MVTSTRRTVLGALLIVGVAGIGTSAVQQAPGGRGLAPPGPPVIEVELKENLFLLKGGGGNTAAFIVADGVILVDTKIPGWGKPLIDKVQELTDKPITTLISPKYTGYQQPPAERLRANVQMAFEELK